MKKQTGKRLVIGSILALTLALAFWSPAPAQSAEPEKGKTMMDGKMMTGDKIMMDDKMMTDDKMKERCQEMKGKKQKMMEEMKAQDAELSRIIAQMNSAPADKKIALMAAVINTIGEQRITMHARKAKMEEDMMQHMMQHMQMGKESMSKCPMTMGMDKK